MVKHLSKLDTFAQVFLTLITIIFILTLNIKIVTNFKTLYYRDINLLNIEETSKLSLKEIKLNYNYSIDFIQNHKKEEFNLPTLNSSFQGKIHFAEVRTLFMKVSYLLYLSSFILLSYTMLIKNKNLTFLKWSSFSILFINITCLICSKQNFNKIFVKFHNLFFKNNYWLLNPLTDPIIKIMPEQFFFHCAIGVFLLNILFSLICFILYKLFHNRLSITYKKVNYQHL